MDGDLRPRYRRVRAERDGAFESGRAESGERWGYSATIPAELVEGQAGPATARVSPVQRDLKELDRKSKVKPDKSGRDDGKDEGKTGDDKARDEKDSAKKKSRLPRWKKILYWCIALVILAALITAGVLYWLHARHFEDTDDAFIDGYQSQVSAQVAGKVIDLKIVDNELVKAGQVLLQIEPRDYQVRLVNAQAQKAQAVGQLDQAKAGLLQQQANVDQMQAQVRVAEADLGQQQSDLARFRAVDPKAVTRQQLDTTSAQTKSAAAKLDAAKQAVEGARAQIEAQKSMIEAAAANVQAADASIANANLQLSYSTVVAPQDGRVTQRSVNVGNYANVGQALLAVVPDNFWVTANFKETQLKLMQAGQKVQVTVDACPDKVFEAHVQSFQSGTGSAFSSLPAENATGNYVKVVQRVPVKIVFDKMPEGCRLSLGLSVEPRVTVLP